MVPHKTLSICDFTELDAVEYVLAERPDAKILIVGAGESLPSIKTASNIIFTDVALGPLTDLIADAHDLPFDDASFQAVIIVAVIEHVLDPQKVASEVERVLDKEGILYSNTPFIQQVHMGRYDFTRFTAVGHRYLWRSFDELNSGVSNGPGMALAWTVEYFLRTIFTNSKLESLACYAFRFITYPLMLLDRVLIKRPGVFDAASAFYFFGKKRNTPLTAKEIVATYKGKQQ